MKLRWLLAIAVLHFAAPARAIELKLLGEPLRLDITESLWAAYHGDLGGLIVEHDAAPPGVMGPGEAHPENHFYDVLNRLNVDLAWRKYRLATRFDTSLYFDTPPGSGDCSPQGQMMTPAPLRSKFCQSGYQYFWPEKFSLEYAGRSYEWTLGDFYISFGRGLVLSIRKIDELGIDTTLQGGRFVLHEGNVGAQLAVGVTNIQNIDEATGRWAPDPHDVIAAGRVEYRVLDKITIGLHEVGGVQGTNAVSAAKQHRQDAMLMYGGTIDAPRILPWLALYFEAAGQMKQQTDVRNNGYAIYGAATGYFGPASVLVEFKHYWRFQRWASSVDPSLPEFAPIVYNAPPTAERVQTELVSSVYDVSGPRFRVDWRINPMVLVYASYAYFQDRAGGTPPGVAGASGEVDYHDPYAGLELRWNRGSSHLFPSGGYRIERCANTDCVMTSPPGGEYQHIGHVEWDFAQKLPHNFSIESQGFALFRRGEHVSVEDASGNFTYPSWVEGDAYVAFKWTPYLDFIGGVEWTTRPSQRVNEIFPNGTVQWHITTASVIRLFVGGTRGGLKCISGICRDFPPFTGARLEVVVRL